jgi:hypothetical protein
MKGDPQARAVDAKEHLNLRPEDKTTDPYGLVP